MTQPPFCLLLSTTSAFFLEQCSPFHSSDHTALSQGHWQESMWPRPQQLHFPPWEITSITVWKTDGSHWAECFQGHCPEKTLSVNSWQFPGSIPVPVLPETWWFSNSLLSIQNPFYQVLICICQKELVSVANWEGVLFTSLWRDKLIGFTF